MFPRAEDTDTWGPRTGRPWRIASIVCVERTAFEGESEVWGQPYIEGDPPLGAFSRYNLRGTIAELKPRPSYILTGLQSSVFFAATRPQASHA